MSKINQIQSALKEIDQARFQKLCDAYLRKRGHDNINSSGSVLGKDKVKTGTPDMFVLLPNGRYLFVEYTTERHGVTKKFKKDLAKCFNGRETGVPVEEIEKAILCCNSQLKVGEIRELRKLCGEHGCELDFYGIDVLSHDLAERYPGIAKDYLNIDVDTGQILDQERFVSAYQANAFATRIDTAFLGREADLEAALSELRSNPALLIAGRPGVGKTRFAIECCRRFTEENPGYEVRYIRNLDADLFNDLRLHYKEPGRYIIVIDDANRLTGLDYVLSLLQDADAEHQFKIVCTVRDYAIDKVRRAVATYTTHVEVGIVPFTDDEIKQLVGAEYGIRNNEYLDRIARLSQGNPRIAMMAASIATENQSLTSINDVSALYDRYFDSIAREVENANDPELWRVAGIITFFRSIDRTSNEQMELISSVFGLEVDEFWRNARRLHELEIVDMYEDESIVRVADQILATYLFYRAVFVDRVLSLAPILIGLFPRFRQRLMDAINPVYSAFDEKKVGEVLKPDVLTAWEQFERNGIWDGLWELMEAFWWLAETKVLKAVRDVVEGTESQVRNFKDIDWKGSSAIPRRSPLSILEQLRWSSNPENAVKLMLAYAAKVPDSNQYLVHILAEDYGFHYDSYRDGYRDERMVIDTVWEQWEATGRVDVARLFIAIATEFIKIRHRSTGSYSRHTYTFTDFNLVPTNELQDLRRTMLERMFSLHQNDELRSAVREALNSYPSVLAENDESAIGAWDMKVLTPYIHHSLDPRSFRDCVLVQAILEACRQNRIEYDVNLETIFTNETYALYLFLEDEHDELSEFDFAESQKRRQENIRERFGSYTIDDYRVFLQRSHEILSHLSPDNRNYQCREATLEVILDLLERDAGLFVTMMSEYLSEGDLLGFGDSRIAYRMVDVLGSDAARKVIDHTPLPQRNVWLGGYYPALPPSAITKATSEELVALYKEADVQALPYRFDYIRNYFSAGSEIGTTIVKVLLERGEEDSKFIWTLSHLFRILGRSDPDMEVIASVDRTVLQTAYLQASRAYTHLDLHGHAFNYILDHDPTFLGTYIEYRCEANETQRGDEDRDYSFIWRRADHIVILEQAFDKALEADPPSRYWLDKFFLRLLSLPTETNNKEPELAERIVSALEEIVTRRYGEPEFMHVLFRAASNLNEDARRRLIAKFLAYNKDLHAFTFLSVEPRQWSSGRSWVPVLTKRKEFYESLLPLVSSIELLEHRELLESHIMSLEKRIGDEKRRDFLRD